MSKAGSSQQGYSTRVCQSSPGNNEIFLLFFFFFVKEEDAELLLCGYAARTGQAETGALQIVLILAAALSCLTTKAD